ncbi:MAG: type II CRISPR RNA-guided endonuclease Cas9 [Defluviitaleaceae bacterium]|nr:type II CRISPR RNA-guided endonuclease Cas9 [Defluviitaleaceae bacterium]
MRYNIGLDIGISSVGFAVMEIDEDSLPMRVVRIGSRIFDTAENPKDGSSLAKPRREARGMRRRLRRKRYRKERIRNLIIEKAILSAEQLEKLFDVPLPDIYEIRRDALERIVAKEELARIMLHLAQRRGFASNRKADTADKEAGKMKKAIEQNNASISEKKYRTVGEMLFLDPRYTERKRNKSDYLNVVTRDMVLDEARLIFSTQREMGNAFCSAEVEERYMEILSSQRAFDEGPGAGHAKCPSPYAGDLIGKMVGICRFTGEKRAAKATYSFEYSNLLQKVNHMRIEERGYTFELTEEQRKLIIEKAHTSEQLDYAKIRKLLGLPNNCFFNIHYSSDTDKDEAKTKFNHLPAYHAMRKALNNVSKDRIKYISLEQKNAIGQIFSLYKNDEKIKTELINAGIEHDDIEALISKLVNFRKFGNLSVTALDKIIPHLEKGLTYDKACEEAGYNFKAHGNTEKTRLVRLWHLAEEAEKTITSCVVRRALSQCAKVINAIIREMGESPEFINIELAREMAKDFDERKELEKSMLDNNARNERIKERLKNEFGLTNPTGQDIIKLKLYEDQKGECPYTLLPLDIEQVFNDHGYAEIDHIVPRSISHNNTYANKVLALASEQREKGNRLPLEYLTGKRRDNFIIWVNTSNLRQEKKKRLLKEVITEEERTTFKDRALHDTQTMSRFLLNYLSDYLLFAPSERKRKVIAVNGGTTSTLRKRWGLNKIREDGDLHHAADAAVIACTTQQMINDIARHYNHIETRYMDRSIDPRKHSNELPQPYPHFREELMARLAPTKEKLDVAMGQLGALPYPDNEIAKLAPVFVSRMPSRKVGGAAHKETIKGINENGEQIKKVSLASLKLNKNGEIEGYYRPEDDSLLYSALKEQLLKHGNDGKKAFAEPFYKPKKDGTAGPLVRTVKIAEKSTLNVLLKDPHGRVKASADNDSMVRVDVFYVENDGYYLVPIYVADTIKAELPNRAIVANKPYEAWKEMHDKDFIFSLYSNDLIYIKHKKLFNFSKAHEKNTLPDTFSCNEVLAYYKTTHSGKGSIEIINHDNSYSIGGVGVKTLQVLEKYHVDVLGNISKGTREKRQPFTGQE